MKIYALIDNGIIVNVVVWDGISQWSPPSDDHLVIEIPSVPGSPGVGWSYDGTNFSPPPPSQEQEASQ